MLNQLKSCSNQGLGSGVGFWVGVRVKGAGFGLRIGVRVSGYGVRARGWG